MTADQPTPTAHDQAINNRTRLTHNRCHQHAHSQTLGIEPAAEGEAAGPVRRSQDERWNTNLAAARQFRDREGHLRPARKHVEMINVGGGGEGDQEAVKLGAWLDNTRRRAAKLSPDRRAALDVLGMRW
ncbi:helicase associated domain-containing protein (plasmid) [Streptomyces sp. Qhu-G9]|uniref:helicase associated domain-containing protein n=1 Tax=Streptomyces sp. Qhu-G9 TaxID=3452799 RepID=UPI0022AC4F1C|nr:helicase associated domain-containing protein [Streptomyces aurantiacus]WAU78421.1 helicase associated domain-containing protein [Streptomyces aurantiacus]